MPDMKGITDHMAKQKEKLQETTTALTPLDSPPQDDYTEEDREKLDKILNEIADNIIIRKLK